MLVFTAANRLDAQVNGSKVAGVCFRVDDLHETALWTEYSGIFNRYGYKFVSAANFNLQPFDAAILQTLVSNGHELADHTSDYTTFYFTGPDKFKYKNAPGVDHYSTGLDRVCLTIDRIDTVNSPGEIVVNVRDGFAYSATSHGFPKTVVSYPVLGLYSPERHWFFRVADSQISSSSPDSLSMLVLVSPWGEPVATGAVDNVRLRLIHFHDVSMSDAGMELLARRTVDLCAKYGLPTPTTWVQPGGSSPYLPAAQLKRVWGKFGYTSAGSYANAALKCFNEYNPLADKQFAMENDFDFDSADVTECERIISDMCALHAVPMGVSHFSSSSQSAPPGSWQTFLKKVDTLLAWCKRKNIPVKTHREWGKILYDTPQNPYVNVFPRLDVDLNEDGRPDGFVSKSGVLARNDGVQASGGVSYSIARPGTMCLVQGLGGLEKGMNVFSISTKGDKGDSIEVIFTLHSADDIVKRYVFPATTGEWRKIDTTLTILDDVSICDVEIRALRVGSIPVKVSGMSLSKVTNPAALNVYVIKASAGACGTITPSGSIRVSYGITETFSIVPNAGYKIADVLIDSSSVGPVSTVAFPSVSSNHTIFASFRQNRKPVVTTTAATRITPMSAQLNGTVNPDGPQTSYTFEFGPTVCYGFALPSQTLSAGSTTMAISRALDYLPPGTTYHYRLVATDDDGTDYGNDTTFTTAPSAFGITSSAGPNGRINPLNKVMVEYGDSQTFTIIPNDGYQIDSVFVDDSFVGDSTSYTIQNITAEHKIRATFRQVELVTAAEHLNGSIPTVYALSQNYPNPFNPSTTIQFALPRSSYVTLRVFDALGKEVTTLVTQELGPGYFTVRWQSNVPSGIYFYRLQAGDASAGSARGFVKTMKMILLK